MVSTKRIRNNGWIKNKQHMDQIFQPTVKQDKAFFDDLADSLPQPMVDYFCDRFDREKSTFDSPSFSENGTSIYDIMYKTIIHGRYE